jgi:hypothetical protein
VLAGHFGLAAAVKAREPQTPLWALMFATSFLDVVFVPLYFSGIETIEIVPGTAGGYGSAIIHANYTHSLVGALALAALFGGVAAGAWGRRTGFVLGAVVFSHWVLDLLVHRGDLPILPGDAGGLPRLGFGLWQYPEITAALELALIAIGAFLYWRAALRTTQSTVGVPAWRAHLVGALTLGFGVLVLGTDVLGILP